MYLMFAPYLNRKQFEKFFYPSVKSTAYSIIDKGAIAFGTLEGDFTAYIDFISEFPKGTFVAYVESTDIFELKKKHGANSAVVGGMPIHMLKYSTKEE